MFMTKFKSVLAMVLVVGLALAGAAGLLRPTHAAEPPKGAPASAVSKNDQKDEKGRPTTKEESVPTTANPVPKVLTPEEAIKLKSKEKVIVRFKVTAVQDMSRIPTGGFGQGFIVLKDGSSFSIRLVPPAMNTLMSLDIEPAKHFTGKVVRVTGFVQPDPVGSSFHIRVDDLNQSQFLVTKE